MDVPIQQLLSDDFASERRALINPEKAFPVMPPAGELDGYGFTPFPATANGSSPLFCPLTLPILAQLIKRAMSVLLRLRMYLLKVL